MPTANTKGNKRKQEEEDEFEFEGKGERTVFTADKYHTYLIENRRTRSFIVSFPSLRYMGHCRA